MDKTVFRKELEQLLDRSGSSSVCSVPSFVLAEYMTVNVYTFIDAMNSKEAYAGHAVIKAASPAMMPPSMAVVKNAKPPPTAKKVVPVACDSLEVARLKLRLAKQEQMLNDEFPGVIVGQRPCVKTAKMSNRYRHIRGRITMLRRALENPNAFYTKARAAAQKVVGKPFGAADAPTVQHATKQLEARIAGQMVRLNKEFPAGKVLSEKDKAARKGIMDRINRTRRGLENPVAFIEQERQQGRARYAEHKPLQVSSGLSYPEETARLEPQLADMKNNFKKKYNGLKESNMSDEEKKAKHDARRRIVQLSSKIGVPPTNWAARVQRAQNNRNEKKKGENLMQFVGLADSLNGMADELGIARSK